MIKNIHPVIGTYVFDGVEKDYTKEILKGDISLIGPRPITAKEQFFLDKEAPDNVKRYATMPGAMLNYPRLQKLTPKPRTAIEENYLENWSLKTDIKHFYKTIKDIISGNNF